MIKSIHTVAVIVSNMTKASAWYTEKLGFEVLPEAHGHWMVVGAKGESHGLHLCEAAPAYGTALEPGNTGIMFGVDDLEKTMAELKARGIKVAKDITRESWGTYAMIEDPDGNVFWLMPAGH